MNIRPRTAPRPDLVSTSSASICVVGREHAPTPSAWNSSVDAGVDQQVVGRDLVGRDVVGLRQDRFAKLRCGSFSPSSALDAIEDVVGEPVHDLPVLAVHVGVQPAEGATARRPCPRRRGSRSARQERRAAARPAASAAAMPAGPPPSTTTSYSPNSEVLREGSTISVWPIVNLGRLLRNSYDNRHLLAVPISRRGERSDPIGVANAAAGIARRPPKTVSPSGDGEARSAQTFQGRERRGKRCEIAARCRQTETFPFVDASPGFVPRVTHFPSRIHQNCRPIATRRLGKRSSHAHGTEEKDHRPGRSQMGNLRTASLVLGCSILLARASFGDASSASQQEMRSLDEQVQEIKSDVLGIAAD